YGGVNKLLCALSVSHSDPVPRGARLHRWSEEKQQWRDLGMVTSWAYSFEHDTGQVLAYIKRRHQEPGTVFRLEEGPSEATLLAETPL
ncbi:MAG: glycine cleavage system aminomethyltransferase T, partial [Candidatus Paceibacteria bacterium]